MVGDRGRIVVPADVRARAGLTTGTPLVMLETPAGLVLLTRDQLRARVRDELSGLDLVGDLIEERRRGRTGGGPRVTVVLDASAILVFVQEEAGADVVERALLEHARCGAANWSEVAQKVLAAERDWDLVRALLTSYEVEIEAVSTDDAEWAAGRWRRGEGLSLADRLCLGLAERLDAEVLTADRAWGTDGSVTQIR